MEHFKISSLGELKDEDQKSFFSYVDVKFMGTKDYQQDKRNYHLHYKKHILAKQGKKEVKEEDAEYDKMMRNQQNLNLM